MNNEKYNIIESEFNYNYDTFQKLNKIKIQKYILKQKKIKKKIIIQRLKINCYLIYIKKLD